MSGFNDIATAYTKHGQTKNWKDVTYGLIYTCNCGWLDMGHLNPTSKRAEIGAANLWKQVKTDGPAAVRAACKPQMSDTYPGATFGRMWASGCFDDIYYRFPDGRKGFVVHYRQDHGGIPLKPGVSGRFIVKTGLNEERRKRIALSIFMNVSLRFEQFQSTFSLWDTLTNSGFSQEDLVSNLIGFYIAVGAIDKETAISTCSPVSRATAEHVWKTEGPVGENKNRNFSPILSETGFHDHVNQMCRDDCMHQPKIFPEIFKTIKPLPLGEDYVRM